MTVAIETEGRGALCVKITGVASAAGGGVGYVANPEGATVVILRTTVYFKTKSAGSATLSIGIAAAVTTSAADILNALDVNGVTDGTVYNGHAMQNTAKTEITAPAVWHSTDYITFTGSATTVGLEAYLFVEYIRAA